MGICYIYKYWKQLLVERLPVKKTKSKKTFNSESTTNHINIC